MTDKEKAKAYDEALKRAKITLDCCGSTSIITKNTIYDIFPELQESEDEKVRKEIVSIFHSLAEGKIPSPVNYADIFTWLEKQGGEKPAWSEEDEIKIKSIIAFLKSPSLCAMDGNKGIIDANIKYLKSLKNKVQPQNTWKPSEEQIVVLELASKYERVFTPKQIDILIGLKEQLKKLKE